VEPGGAAEGAGLLREGQVKWVRTLAEIPTTRSAIEAAYERNQSQRCEPVPPGEPLALTAFQPHLTRRDVHEYGVDVPATSIRQHIFSLGLDMLGADKGTLPVISRLQILGYLSDHYVSIQVRVQKDPATGALFLHHRPLAAVAAFRQARLTREPPAAVMEALKDYRSLGVFLPEGVEPTPANLNTLVLVFKRDVSDAGISGAAYEFAFVRAREAVIDGDRALELHTFVTYDDRRELHYLQPCPDPSRSNNCSLTTMLYFTKFVDGGLRPVDGGSRGSTFRSRSRYSMDAIAEHTRAQGWEPLAELTRTLDEIIDRRITDERTDQVSDG
jgi:hypothetical protein